MAKGPTFDTITAAFASASLLNANFASIVTSFTNTISRDGSTPNQMLADFDMNSNDILNAGVVNATDIVIAGLSLIAQVDAAAASATAAALSATNALASEVAAAASAATAATLTEFTTLTDTPSTYSGQGSKFVKVNSGGTALEFIAGSASEPSDGDKGDITVTGSGLTWNLDAGVVAATELATNAVTTVKITDGNVTLAKIAGAAKSGNDATLVTGTAGTTNFTSKWDANGDLIDGFEVLDEDNMASDSNTKLVTQQSIKKYVDDNSGTRQLFHLQDQQSDGAAGGTFTSGAPRKRTLISVTNNIPGASVSGSVITLPIGTYEFLITCPAVRVDEHQAKLRNTSDSTDDLIGTSEISDSGDNFSSSSIIRGELTIAGIKNFEVQHECKTTKATNGFGRPGSFGVGERYTDAMIWKV